MLPRQLRLDVARLALERRAVLEELVHTPPVGLVLRRQVVRLRQHLVHLAVGA